MTKEERKMKEDEDEFERRQVIMNQMREKYNYYRKLRHEDEIYWYISDESYQSQFSEEQDDFMEDEMNNDDEYSDY